MMIINYNIDCRLEIRERERKWEKGFSSLRLFLEFLKKLKNFLLSIHIHPPIGAIDCKIWFFYKLKKNNNHHHKKIWIKIETWRELIFYFSIFFCFVLFRLMFCDGCISRICVFYSLIYGYRSMRPRFVVVVVFPI